MHLRVFFDFWLEKVMVCVAFGKVGFVRAVLNAVRPAK
jgi:hypothetical protein